MGRPRRRPRRRGKRPDLVPGERRRTPARTRISSTPTASTSTGPASIRLTEAEANHAVTYSSDGGLLRRHLVARRPGPGDRDRAGAADGRVGHDRREAATSRRSSAAGWKAARGLRRQGPRRRRPTSGASSIRPSTFDPGKKYPVIENIYAGPHGSFVPKSFSRLQRHAGPGRAGLHRQSRCDGMGTSNRSKAFHDVCWKNIGDAGFPDRILWHKAVAAKYPYYDITRVGIYGTSAGGQNALGGLLFHPEFYKAGVSAVRLPRQPHGQDLVERAVDGLAARARIRRLLQRRQRPPSSQGKLLLIVGEMDTNVDPASTMQVVNALIKANKVFDLLVIPGAGHGMGGAYGERKMYDFFVRHLLGAEPPNWNEPAKTN
ncbi:MAG: S9 family peptidase [Candidatus Moduliflexus flocculans]|nr:S9 family peptidase [Candidatus Moduliflexus flocculans]